MTGPARLVVQVWHGDVIAHEFSRSTSQPTAAGVQTMCNAALGWLQAWSGQLSEDRWQADVVRARQTQQALVAEEPSDEVPLAQTG